MEVEEPHDLEYQPSRLKPLDARVGFAHSKRNMALETQLSVREVEHAARHRRHSALMGTHAYRL